jgi:hypothetical protein
VLKKNNKKEAGCRGGSRRYELDSGKLAKLCHLFLRAHIDNGMLNLVITASLVILSKEHMLIDIKKGKTQHAGDT